MSRGRSHYIRVIWRTTTATDPGHATEQHKTTKHATEQLRSNLPWFLGLAKEWHNTEVNWEGTWPRRFPARVWTRVGAELRPRLVWPRQSTDELSRQLSLLCLKQPSNTSRRLASSWCYPEVGTKFVGFSFALFLPMLATRGSITSGHTFSTLTWEYNSLDCNRLCSFTSSFPTGRRWKRLTPLDNSTWFSFSIS